MTTGLTAELTSAIRDLGLEVELQGRALGTSARKLVAPGHLLDLLTASASILGSATRPEDETSPGEVVIVDRTLTRC